MNSQIAASEQVCPRREIAVYVDGELSPREELELEMHLAICAICKTELNEQKKLLFALDFALENEEQIVLPANFTKVIVTTAESNVNGLRRPQERTKALFVCASLFLLVILGLGSETGTILNTFRKFADQFLAVAGFVFHLVYDISVGIAVILRSLSHQVVFDAGIAAFFVISLFFVSLLLLSRKIVRLKRT